MSCQRTVWRYKDCEHEEEFEISCSFFGDANHVHNTVVLSDPHRPVCSICHPPNPPTGKQIRNLHTHMPKRHLPGPRSIQALCRGYNAEILGFRGIIDGRPGFPVAEGEAVNSGTGYGSRGMDTLVNANMGRGSARGFPYVAQGGLKQAAGSDHRDPVQGNSVPGGPSNHTLGGHRTVAMPSERNTSADARQSEQ
ncbi:MAG: hypothetical protein L6R35_004663 [Caloplaca aegaea]|nr:MAG: hypothetical protein L6R35_004663 [Caloplaca aegaea]